MYANEWLAAETSVTDRGGRVVRLIGELDLAGSEWVATLLESAVDHAGPAGLTVDLSELTFIDASGIRALARGRHRAEAASLPMSLHGAHDLVARVVILCGLADIVEAIASGWEQAATGSSKVDGQRATRG